jgi:hypothetical protein
LHQIRAKRIGGKGGRILDAATQEICLKVEPYRSRNANQREIDIDMIESTLEFKEEESECEEDQAFLEELRSFDNDEEFD